MEIVTMYEQLGVSRAVYEYGEAVLRDLRPRFDVIDQTTGGWQQTALLLC